MKRYILAAAADLSDISMSLRIHMAKDPRTRLSILKQLAEDSEVAVRYWVRKNPSVPEDIRRNISLISDSQLYHGSLIFDYPASDVDNEIINNNIVDNEIISNHIELICEDYGCDNVNIEFSGFYDEGDMIDRDTISITVAIFLKYADNFSAAIFSELEKLGIEDPDYCWE